MAAPTIRSEANTAFGTGANSFAINYPATISAGDTLLCAFVSDGNRTVTWPTSPAWTEIANYDNAGIVSLNIAWIEATGSESGTFTVTTSGFEQAVAHVYAIQDADDPDTNPPEVSTGATGNNTTPDPDSLTPGGGSDDYLYFAFYGQDGNTTAGTVEPSGYTGDQTDAGTGASCAIGYAYKGTTGSSSDDPGTFTNDGTTDEWVACTVGVYPTAAAGGGTTNPFTMAAVDLMRGKLQ